MASKLQKRHNGTRFCSLLCIKTSGGASAVKEPGHFEVRKSSSQVTRMHIFPQKSWPFLLVALKTQAANAVSPSK